jgi:elongation factor P
MVQSQQLNAGMCVCISGSYYRVESAVKVTVPKGNPFMKLKLRELKKNKVVEKSLKLNESVEEVPLEGRPVEFLYMEGKDYLFLDLKDLEQVLIPKAIVGEAVDFLKQGVELKASFYGDTVFSLELPQFMELMVTEINEEEESVHIANSSRLAILETGAKIEVPLFVEEGDIVKVDTKTGEYIQRV